MIKLQFDKFNFFIIQNFCNTKNKQYFQKRAKKLLQNIPCKFGFSINYSS